MSKRWCETHQNGSLGQCTYVVVFPDAKLKTLMEFMTNIAHIRNVRRVLDTYRIFNRGNAVFSKRNWLEFATGKRPHVYDKFISFQDIKDTDILFKLIDKTP